MHLHPLQKLHVKAANDNEIDKEDFAWRILKIQLVKKKKKNSLTYLKGESISCSGTRSCCLHFKMTVYLTVGTSNNM